jgi:hypothetical protein
MYNKRVQERPIWKYFIYHVYIYQRPSRPKSLHLFIFVVYFMQAVFASYLKNHTSKFTNINVGQAQGRRAEAKIMDVYSCYCKFQHLHTGLNVLIQEVLFMVELISC